jgi:hypothetical protein
MGDGACDRSKSIGSDSKAFSSSACSVIVSEIFREPTLKLHGSSAIRRGLCLLVEWSMGLNGRLGLLTERCRPLESKPGEEWARVIGGAARGMANDRDREWIRVKGVAFRGGPDVVEGSERVVVKSRSRFEISSDAKPFVARSKGSSE